MKEKVSEEKKLQLVKKIREEHMVNREALHEREHYLYGKAYQPNKDSGYDASEENEKNLWVSTGFRTLISILLFIGFLILHFKHLDFYGVSTQSMSSSLQEDYSGNVFDFINKIPYTLHEPSDR